MKRNKTYLVISAVLFGLLLVTVAYELFGNNDPYKFHTGIGDHFSLSSDDSSVLFSYYLNGSEAIYRADLNGSNVEQITGHTDQRHRSPDHSADGNYILYLSRNKEGVQTLYVAERMGGIR